jgi:hypothetical protein
MSVANHTKLTPADLLNMSDGKDYELVNGELKERPVSLLSSWVGGKLHALVSLFCDENDNGMVWPSDTGCQFLPDAPNTVRR